MGKHDHLMVETPEGNWMDRKPGRTRRGMRQRLLASRQETS
jgi:hypothetical protein